MVCRSVIHSQNIAILIVCFENVQKLLDTAPPPPPPLSPMPARCKVFPISQVLGFKHTEPRNTAVIEAIMRWATLSWNTSIQLPVWIILCLCIHAIMDFYCPIIHQLHRISITRITAQMRVCDMHQDPIQVFFFFFKQLSKSFDSAAVCMLWTHQLHVTIDEGPQFHSELSCITSLAVPKLTCASS